MRADGTPTPSSAAGAGSGSDPARLRRATRLMREFIEVSERFERSLAQQLEVNATDLDAMQHLIMSGPLAPTELARRLNISTASTTKAIDRLVALGHVSRQPNPSDRRGVIVVPAPESRERAMARLIPMIHGVDAALDAFDGEEQRIITDYLERVVAVCEDHARG